jgi:hypothetical protein
LKLALEDAFVPFFIILGKIVAVLKEENAWVFGYFSNIVRRLI